MKLFFLYILFFFSAQLSAQSPGGVSTNLQLWLRADAGTGCFTDGCSVTTWSDQSSNGRNASRSAGTGNLRLSTINYNSVLDVEDVNRTFSTSSLTARTIIYTGQTNTSGRSGCCNGFLGLNGDKGIRQRSDNVDEMRSNGGAADNNDWTKSSTFYQNGYGNSTGNIFNSTDFHIGGGARTSSYTNTFYIGGYYSNRYFDQSTYYGDVMVYSGTLTTTQRKQVESYLALKYGLTLSNTDGGINGDYIASNGTTTSWDATNGAGYHNDVIGIGRDGNTALYQKQSQQTDDLTRLYLSTLSSSNSNNAGTFGGDRQFVVMGHNNEAINSDGSTEFPGGEQIYSRLEREWKITNTAFTGTFSIDITLNTTPVTASHLRVLIDSDGNFSNATVYSPSISISGSTVTITGLSTTMIPSNTTRYLTLASLNATTPLPIELIKFEASKNSNWIDLNWETASEINNDYFVVEKSIDSKEWSQVITLAGAGNSSTKNEYSEIDLNPYIGISYYRLKQMDYNESLPIQTL